MSFERNEISEKSHGGTELQIKILEENIPVDLLENFQIISSRVRELDETKIRIMSFHDLPNDPEVANFKDQNFRNKFHHFVFISDWQQWSFARELGLPLTIKNSTIEVGFKPIDAAWEAKAASPIMKFCYTSTPQRGLEILIPTFINFNKQYPDTQLDVFSSFKIYGWEEKDKLFQPLYDQIIAHPSMNYHSYVPHDELLEYLKAAHVFAYPCTWPETSCKSMEEAMSAGLLCIHPNFAGLPASSGGLNMMYQWDDNKNTHAQVFHNELIKGYNLIRDPTSMEYLKYVKGYTDNRYNISRITAIWTNLLTQLLNRYPTVESRKFQDDMIYFDTNAPRR